LVVSVAVPLILFFGLTILVLDSIFRDLAAQALRAQLEEQIIALVTAAETNDKGRIDVHVLDPESRLITPGSGHYALVRTRPGEVLWSAPSLAGIALDFGPSLPAGQTSLFYRQINDGTRVAVLSRGLQWEYTPGNGIDLTFSVADDMAAQQAQLWRFRQQLIGWFALLTLLLLAALGWLLRRALAPIRRLQREIGEVEAGGREQLGVGYPRELAGVAGNLNTLLQSERRRIGRYRDTLGNLAHSLKTPLAVMRAALAGGGDARATVDREIDRVGQIVDHQLKRATGGAATLGQATVAIAPIAADLRATLLKVHGKKDLAIDLDLAAGAGFLGDRGDVIELLGNLLDNACKWCRGRVRLQVRVDAERLASLCLWMCVEDDGPGIAPLDRSRVLARGVRADERAPGHGLGLAMASDTVASYNGELAIGTSAALGGARVEVRLPGRIVPPAA
jgi:two-component system sensor histidine kinase PhoQ